MVKNQPAIQETWLQSLGWEDPLEEGMATHSSILVWRIPMARGAWWATVHRAAKSQTRLSDFTFTFYPLYKLQATLYIYVIEKLGPTLAILQMNN